MNSRRLSLLLLAGFLVCDRSRGATILWTNISGGDFSAATNWSPAQVPAAGDTAVITNAGTYSITNSASISLTALMLGATNGTQTLNATSLALTGASLVNSNGILNWSGGNLDGSLLIAAGGVMTISNSVTFSYANAALGYTNTAFLTNNGSVLWDGNISSYANPSGYGGGGLIQNNGLWRATADNALNTVYSGGTNLFINTGGLQKIGGAGSTVIGWSLHNTGSITTPAGAFSIASWFGNNFLPSSFNLSGGNLSGSLTILSNAVLNFLGGAVAGSTTVAAGGAFTWSGGSLEGALIVASGGRLTISNSVIFSYANAAFGYTNTGFLTNYGSVLWSGTVNSYANPSGYGGGAVIENDGLWQAVSDNSLTTTYSNGTNLFINNGILQKTGGTSSSTIGWPFNSGNGTLLSSTGAFAFNAWVPNGVVRGNVTVSGNNITGIIVSNAVLNWAGGSLDGALTVQAGATLTISNSVNFSYANASYGYTNTAALTNYGTVIWAANAASYANPSGYGGGAIIYNAGFWETLADVSLTANYANATNLFINVGYLEKIGGASAAVINWNFQNNNGTINTPTGTFTMINWTGNGLMRGNATVSGTLSGMVASNAVLNWAGGNLDGSLTINQGGLMTISNTVNFSYSNAAFGYTNTSFLTNYGTMLWVANASSYGNPSGYGGGAVIHNAGLWQTPGDFNLSANYQNATNLFLNLGTLQKIAGGGPSTIGWEYRNNNGTMTTATGSFSITKWTGNGSVHGNAVVAGSISGTIAPGAIINWAGGNLSGAATVAAGGTLSISNSVTFSYDNAALGYTNTAYLTNFGTVLWAGNASSYGNPPGYGGGALIYNAGHWQAVADVTLSVNYSGATNLFLNTGTLEKLGGAGTSTLQFPFNNQGTVRAVVGTLGFASDAIQTAGLTSLEGGILSASQSLQLLGGLLTGTNSIVGNVTNSGAVVSLGAAPGKLSITGNYFQTTNGSLRLRLAGTAPGVSYDQVAVSGGARVSGSLIVTFATNYVPVTNTTFTILTAAPRTGIFAPFTFPSTFVGMVPIYNSSSVVLLVTNAPPPFGPVLLNGAFYTHFIGIPGTNYTIEYTPLVSPVHWQKLTNLLAPTNDYGLGLGAMEFIDPITSSNRFYRTVTPAY